MNSRARNSFHSSSCFVKKRLFVKTTTCRTIDKRFSDDRWKKQSKPFSSGATVERIVGVGTVTAANVSLTSNDVNHP